MVRFMSTNSTEAVPSIFAATAIFAFFRTGSGVSKGRSDAGPSVFAPTVGVPFFATGSDVSEGCPDAGPSVFPPTVVVSFFGTVSGVAEVCECGETSDSFTFRESVCFSTGSASFARLVAVGPVAIEAFFGFTIVVAGSGLNDTRFSSIGLVAAVFEKQPLEVQVSPTPRGGGQLQPTKTAHRAPMRSVLINSLPRDKILSALSAK